MPERHLEEKLNRRAVYLRIRKKLWVIPVSMAGAALLCFVLYTLVITAVSGQRKYSETSTYEISFAFNEDTQTAYDYYNAATWQDVIFTHPGVTDVLKSELPEGMSLEEARQDTKADLVSDIRFLSVEVTAETPEKTLQLSKAIGDGLESFGKSAKEFDSIKYLSSTGPDPVVVSDRSRNAALLGAFLGLLVSAFALWLSEVLDDGIYVPEDGQRRYGLPVLAVLAGKNADVLPAFLKEEIPGNFAAVFESSTGAGKILLMSLEGREAAQKVLEQLRGVLPPDLYGRFVPAGAEDKTDLQKEWDGAVLLLPAGRGRGTRTEHLLSQFLLHGIAARGIILCGADGKYLRDYYK